MRLADPQALVPLLLLPPFLWWLSRRGAPVGADYPTMDALARLRPSWAAHLRRALPWLRVLVLILIVVALARPQYRWFHREHAASRSSIVSEPPGQPRYARSNKREIAAKGLVMRRAIP